MKYKIETTFDNSVSYVSDKESALEIVRHGVRKEGRKKTDYIITKL